MIPQPPSGQGPIDPRGALSPPPPPDGGMPASAGPAGMGQQMGGYAPPPGAMPPGMMPPGQMPPGMMQAGMMPAMAPMQGLRPPGPFPAFFNVPRRGGSWRTFFIVVLCLGLVLSIFVNVMFIGGGAGVDGGSQSTIVPGDSKHLVAVVPLVGVIDENLEAHFSRFMSRAQEDGNVKALVILIDTPGGTVSASDEIYKRIRKFKSQKNVPIVVAMRSMATSGGYYAACAADYITAERTTLTGNIGVLLPRYNVSKLMKRWDIDDDTIIAKGAIYKYAGSPFRPTNERDNAYFQSQVDSAFDIFKQVVSDGRKGKLKGNINDIANGMAYTGAQALKLGLVDEIDNSGYLDAAVAYAAKQAGLTNPTVVQYQETPSFLERLSSAKFAGGQPSARGITINLDASVLDRLSSPRAMYLYQAPTAEDAGAPAILAK